MDAFATPLKAVAEQGNKGLAALLIKYGASFEELDVIERTPVFTAVASGNQELALFFIEKGADISLVCGAYNMSILDYALSSTLENGEKSEAVYQFLKQTVETMKDEKWKCSIL